MKKTKREAKSIVSTDQGMREVRVIIDFTPEDMVEHMCTCVLGELSTNEVYSNLPDKSVLNRHIKSKLVERKK